jgi:hypothetical protein
MTTTYATAPGRSQNFFIEKINFCCRSFGSEPHLRQDVCVDVVPVADDDDDSKLQQLQDTLVKQAERYAESPS